MKRSSIFVIIAALADLLLFYAALVAILFSRYANTFALTYTHHILPFTAIFALWLLVFGAFGLYDLRLMKNNRNFLERLLGAMAINVILAIILFYLFPLIIEPRRNLALIAGVSIILIAAWRYLFNLLILRAPAHRVIFFAPTVETLELVAWLQKNLQLGQSVVAAIQNGGGKEIFLPGVKIFSFQKNLLQIVKEINGDTVIIPHEIRENKELVKELFQVVPAGTRVVEFSAFYEELTGKVPHSLLEEGWFLENLIGIEKPQYEFLKRILDLLAACLIALPALALFPLLALAILFSKPSDLLYYRTRRARPGDGLVFFRQKRVGKNGRIFDFIKFRSQILGAEKFGETKELKRDPRQYAVGKILRRAYLDELPQIWNVLRGEMSFVGPRPERPEYAEALKKKVPFYEMRLLVLPGITGWAQINMENDASVEDAPEKMQYDLYYIKNRSLLLDLRILLKTLFTLLRRSGR